MSQADLQELPIDAPEEEAPAAPVAEPVAEPEAPLAEPQPPKPTRGRPPGSKHREPKAKPAPKKRVKKPSVPPPSEDEESLPQYVQESLPPPQPQDLAAQLFGLLQSHERQRVDRRRATYASWVSRF